MRTWGGDMVDKEKQGREKKSKKRFKINLGVNCFWHNGMTFFLGGALSSVWDVDWGIEF